jgi:hypothetical protein
MFYILVFVLLAAAEFTRTYFDLSLDLIHTELSSLRAHSPQPISTIPSHFATQLTRLRQTRYFVSDHPITDVGNDIMQLRATIVRSQHKVPTSRPRIVGALTLKSCTKFGIYPNYYPSHTNLEIKSGCYNPKPASTLLTDLEYSNLQQEREMTNIETMPIDIYNPTSVWYRQPERKIRASFVLAKSLNSYKPGDLLRILLQNPYQKLAK